ncbi:MAG: TIGR00725 family protein [Deltaproteobacteria bacterium]
MRLGENGNIICLDMQTVIGVIGRGVASEEELNTAYEVGREIAKRDIVLVSGGMGGVMEAACRGAKTEGGLTVGIIPGIEKGEANPYVDIPVVTGMGHGRNIIVVHSSDAIIAIGGSYGTLSEIAFALRLRIPIIGINTWDVSSEIKNAESPGEAVDMAIRISSSLADRGMR